MKIHENPYKSVQLPSKAAVFYIPHCLRMRTLWTHDQENKNQHLCGSALCSACLNFCSSAIGVLLDNYLRCLSHGVSVGFPERPRFQLFKLRHATVATVEWMLHRHILLQLLRDRAKLPAFYRLQYKVTKNVIKRATS
jgi:hypothetical protein